MRVGIDASNLREGGGITHLRELLSAAEPQEQGIASVIVWANGATLKQLPDRPWLERVHRPLLDRPLPVRWYWRSVRLPRLAASTCDLLFIPGGGPGIKGKPFVTMSQNLLPFATSEIFRYLGWRNFVRLLALRLCQSRWFRGADGLIFLTPYARCVVRGSIGNLRGEERIIPHGVDDRFRLAPRTQLPPTAYSPEHPFRLLYVSKIDLYKHQWHVAKAVARLRQYGFPITLDLVGPAYAPALHRLRKVMQCIDPGQEFIRYYGPVPHGELSTYYHRADAFVFASSCENMPIILLEAMASGLPIVCSNRGPMPEVLGQAGVYFDPERPAEIVAALKCLISDAVLREECAWAAYERAQCYSWERCARETLAFLAGVASGEARVGTGVPDRSFGARRVA